MVDSSILIDNGLFVELLASNAASLIDSSLNFQKVNFINEMNNTTSFIFAINSDINLENILLNGFGNNIFDLTSKSLIVESCYFMNNKNASYFKTSGVPISISNSIFYGEISNLFFDVHLGSSLSMTNISIEFSGESTIGMITSI